MEYLCPNGQVDTLFPARDPQINKLSIHGNLKPGLPYALSHVGSTLDVPFCSDPQNETNLCAAFRKRLGPVRPKVNRRKLHRLGKFVQHYLVANFTPLPYMPFSDALEESWLDHCDHYNQARKDTFRRRFSEFKDRGYRLWERDYQGESFIKKEFYPDPKPPRFINSRSDIFKAALGPYIKAIEDQVYKDPHFVKGQPIDQLPQKLIKLKPWNYILETDYTSFESSFNRYYVQEVELRMFRYFLQNNPDVLALVEATYIRNGQERIQVMSNPKYQIRITGCRMSGELWTSLANGFSNLMNMLFLCAEKHLRVDGYVEGDDGLFGLDSPSLTPQDFADLGFSIKMEYENQVQFTTFCGNTFSDESMKLLVNPENIGRLFWTCNPQYLRSKNHTLDSLFKAKAQSLYVTGRYTPVAGILAYRTLLKYQNVQSCETHQYWRHEIQEMFKNIPLVQPVINYHDRVLYSWKFGLPISDQLLLETLISKLDLNQPFVIPYQFMANSNVASICSLHD